MTQIMRLSFFLFFGLMILISCNNKSESTNESLKFDKVKWETTEDGNYPYRALMLDDILYNDSLRTLDKSEIMAMLGDPSYYREDPNYLHYTISGKKAGNWKIKTKTLIVKIDSASQQVEWIKLHN